MDDGGAITISFAQQVYSVAGLSYIHNSITFDRIRLGNNPIGSVISAFSRTIGLPLLRAQMSCSRSTRS